MMRRAIALVLALIISSSVQASDPEIESLKTAIEELRTDYEARISELERRLAVAEQNAAQANLAAQQSAVPVIPSSGSANSAFNPAIGIIFQGYAWSYGNDPDNYAIQGFPLGGEAGPITQGLSIGETEINVNANVDDKFTAWLTAPIVIEDGVAAIEIEEAWIATTALPSGLSAKFGRFYSGIGYQNNRHAHTWDFADQPLPYQAFLGDQYLDDGVQLRWVAPTILYMNSAVKFCREAATPRQVPAIRASDRTACLRISVVTLETVTAGLLVFLTSARRRQIALPAMKTTHICLAATLISSARTWSGSGHREVTGSKET